MMRSLVTLASTDAAATQAATRSPFQTASVGAGSPAIGKPSVRTYDGAGSRRRTACRMARTFMTCSPQRSTSVDGTTTTDHDSARRTTSSYACSRAASVSSLESASPGTSPRRPDGSTAAATTSGPAQAPRPASSAPATSGKPLRCRTRS